MMKMAVDNEDKLAGVTDIYSDVLEPPDTTSDQENTLLCVLDPDCSVFYTRRAYDCWALILQS